MGVVSIEFLVIRPTTLGLARALRKALETAAYYDCAIILVLFYYYFCITLFTSIL